MPKCTRSTCERPPARGCPSIPILLLGPKDEDEVFRKPGPVMLVEIKPQIIVHMNLIVPMTDWGPVGRDRLPGQERPAPHGAKAAEIRPTPNRS
jgi:hypothetical protein